MLPAAIERLEARQLLTAVSPVMLPSAVSSVIAAAPQPHLPIEGTGSIDATPTLTWYAVENSAGYEVQIDDLTTGDTAVVTGTTTGLSFTPGTTLPLNQSLHKYSWRVRGVDSEGGTGPWSDARTFFVHTSVRPEINSPLNVTRSNNRLDWTAVPGADRYDLWINDLTTGESGVYRNQELDPSQTEFRVGMNLLPAGHSYIWTVRGVADDGTTSEWATHRVFHTKITVSPLGPTETITDQTPRFEWSEASTRYYDLWVNDLTTGESGIIRETRLSNPFFTPTTEVPSGHSYLWTVRAIDERTVYQSQEPGGELEPVTVYVPGAWAKHQTFRVLDPESSLQALPAPEILSEPTTMRFDPVMTWSEVPGAARYDVWVNDLTTGTIGVLRDQHVEGTSLDPTGILLAGHNYIWTVRAIADDGTAGAWAAHQVFHPTNVISLTSPVSETFDVTPTFRWTAAFTEYYEIWVNDLTTGESGIIRENQITTNSYTPGTALPDGHTFVWTVRAIDRAEALSGRARDGEFELLWIGTVGPWAEHRTFRTDTSLRVPVFWYGAFAYDLGVVGETTPEFKWAALEGAARYELVIDDLTSGELAVVHQSDIEGTLYSPPISLTEGHQFKASVRAVSDDGVETAWSVLGGFYAFKNVLGLG